MEETKVSLNAWVSIRAFMSNLYFLHVPLLAVKGDIRDVQKLIQYTKQL